MSEELETPEEAGKRYAEKFQDHSIDSLLYAIRPEPQSYAQIVWMAAIKWAALNPEAIAAWNTRAEAEGKE